MMYRIISFVLLLSFKHATRFNVIRLFSKYLYEIFPYITKTTLHLRNRIGRELGDPFRERNARRNAKDGLRIILSSMICRAVCSPSLHLSNSESCKTLLKKNLSNVSIGTFSLLGFNALHSTFLRYSKTH